MKLPHRSRFTPSLQALEDRCVPAATVLNASLLTDGTLRVLGTDGADVVSVEQSVDQISVRGLSILASGRLVPSLNITDVKKIEVFGYGGNDNINMQTVNLPSLLLGGDGDDTIIGGSAIDYLFGGNGTDRLWGRKGNDRLFGEAGNDSLYGEDGNDILNGGLGRDKYIGGNSSSPSTDFDLYRDAFNPAAPIQDGASASDVIQALAPNCQTLAALATMASQRGTAYIQDKIAYLGSNNYQVFLVGEGRWVNVTFDGTWSDTDARPSGLDRLDQPEFWTILMNRARLSTFGINCLAQYSEARWNDIDLQAGYRLKAIQNALFQFTGNYSVVADRTQITFAYLSWSLDEKNFVAAASFYASKAGLNSLGIAANHAYAVTRAFSVNGQQYVELYNPWGTDSWGNITIDRAPGSSPINDGFITLSWSDFLYSFSRVMIA